MIISVSIIFFILEAPVLIFICLWQGQYIKSDWPHIRFVWTLMNLMMYTNHVINFFSYCMTGTKFRRELLRLLYMHKAFKFMSMYKSVNIFTSTHHGAINNNNNMRTLILTRSNLNLINKNVIAASGGSRNLVVKTDANMHHKVLNLF
jgi:hypothetical protein